jgi:hypothetical protein
VVSLTCQQSEGMVWLLPAPRGKSRLSQSSSEPESLPSLQLQKITVLIFDIFLLFPYCLLISMQATILYQQGRELPTI